MSCPEILHIVGDVASILTIIGFIYGLCKWIKSKKANIKILEIKKDGRFYYLSIYNDGPAEAKNIRICNSFNSIIESSAIIYNLKPGEKSKLSFKSTTNSASFSIKLSWKDSMSHHTKRHKITPLNTTNI